MRTDNDTWDIQTSVGSTALFVAAARALEAQKPDPVAVDPFAEIFCRAVGGQWSDLLDGAAPEHALKSEFGADFVSFQGVRTKYFDTYFLKAAAAGVRQIVLLAAGLDSRAYRLDWPAETVVFELDQPQVLEFKRNTLAGCRPTAQRREVPVDLRNDWPHALLEHGFDPSSPSAWIVEGLLIYLPATAQVQLFTGIDALSAPGSHAAIEESAPMDAAVFAAKQEEERAGGDSARGGPFFQLVYNEQHEPAAQWFGARGWRADATSLPDYLRAHRRRVPAPDSDAGSMTATISLISAIKG
jgi:methyltransferase (TIGR00027 family)